MWDVICRVFLCHALDLTLKPGVNVLRRTSISCGFENLFLYHQFIQMYSTAEYHIVVTHVPGANKHCDHVWFRLFKVLVLHLLKQLTEAFSFLKLQQKNSDLKN